MPTVIANDTLTFYTATQLYFLIGFIQNFVREHFQLLRSFIQLKAQA